MASDYYSTLGVDKSDKADKIKTNYRKLAKKYHPDRHRGDKKAEEKFKEISEAYAVLSDPEKRRKYDRFGSEKFHQQYSSDDIFRGSNLNDILREFGFGDMFGRGFGGGARRQAGFHAGSPFGQPVVNLDVSTEITIPLEEAVKGGERRINLQTDRGAQEISFKIPPGVQDGARLRLAGKGRQAGYKKGDIYIQIKIAPHRLFKREGDDLKIPLEIKISTAMMGGSVEVKTIKGTREVKIPQGTQPGQKIRIKGQGVKHLKGGGAGDLYMEINVRIPKKLTDAQKKLAQLLKAEGL